MSLRLLGLLLFRHLALAKVVKMNLDLACGSFLNKSAGHAAAVHGRAVLVTHACVEVHVVQ